jgi:hypothetical protein
MIINDRVIQWLLDSDPSIRWQVMRDLLNEPRNIYEAERERVESDGWGARLLKRQDPANTWGGGIYSPKWISTTYTMLVLKRLGLPQGNTQAQRACKLFIDRGFYKDGGINFFNSFTYSETCVTGMILSLLCYFRLPDERIHKIADHLLDQQMDDGGWNCRRPKGATHGSFHTTISVLEGFFEYRSTYPRYAHRIKEAVQRGHEFLLIHHLFKSHKTGKVADPAFTRLHFPPRWHYDFIRGLDYFQACNAPRDPRMKDAIDLLEKKQNQQGTWTLNRPWAGRIFFEMEKTGEESRWNTLRALRVLKWWGRW